jgi:DNA-binding response OmpR family regulator
VRAHAGSPLLVLCDMWLAPGENGIDLLRRIHELTVARISGILVSGDTGPETQAAAAAAGYPLLHKPVSPAKLRAAVMSLAWQAETSNGFGMHDENSAG